MRYLVVVKDDDPLRWPHRFGDLQGVHIRVVEEILGHTRVTTTERYTHVATLQMKDASERMDQALWGQVRGQ